MKPKLLYASPFWPQKSGISQYSSILLKGLKDFFETVLLTGDITIDAQYDAFPSIGYMEPIDWDSFDFVLYNFGNNPEYHGYMYTLLKEHPGYIILHDFSLYYLMTEMYQKENCFFQKVYQLEGPQAIRAIRNSIKSAKINNLLEHKNLSSLLPLNQEVLQMAQGVFVHSYYTERMVRQINPDIKTCKINLVQEIPEKNDNCFHPAAISKGFCLGSLGFIAPSKQNHLICEAVCQYNTGASSPITYFMIGEGDYVNSYLGKYIRKTGFLDNDDYFRSLQKCNLILNLRYPYGGESSATVLQAMAYGKPCVVTDIGWFSELPDDCVIKVSKDITSDELAEKLEEWVNGDLHLIGERARKYIEEAFSPYQIARKIDDFMKKSVKGCDNLWSRVKLVNVE